MSAFEVADRVRVIATGETGSVAEASVHGSAVPFVDVLLDGQALTDRFTPEGLERHDGPPAKPGRPGRPLVPGLERFDTGLMVEAMRDLGAALLAALPQAEGLAAAVGNFEAAVAEAVPEPTAIDDGHGNGWKLCGPGCDLAVVEPGKAQCSGARCRS